MILGRKDKDFVETLKKERIQAELDLEKAKRTIKDKDILIKNQDKLIDKLNKEYRSTQETNKRLQVELDRLNLIIQDISKPKCNSCSEVTLDDIFTQLKDIACVNSWNALSEVLNITPSKLLKYRKGTIPLNKETQDNFYYIVTKFSKK